MSNTVLEPDCSCDEEVFVEGWVLNIVSNSVYMSNTGIEPGCSCDEEVLVEGWVLILFLTVYSCLMFV